MKTKKMKTYKPSEVTSEMLRLAKDGKIDFIIKSKDVTYCLTGGLVSKIINNNKVYLFDGEGFKLSEDKNEN